MVNKNNQDLESEIDQIDFFKVLSKEQIENNIKISNLYFDK
jgi:hypothetical protein